MWSRTRGPALRLALAAACVASLAATPTAMARKSRDRLDAVERHVIRLINVERRRYGLHRVRVAAALARAADRHSREMARDRYFAHSSRNGTSAAARVRRFRAAAVTGETLAWLSGAPGRTEARAVVAMWLASPTHRAVLLDGRYRRIGIARRLAGGATFFTADFQSRF